MPTPRRLRSVETPFGALNVDERVGGPTSIELPSGASPAQEADVTRRQQVEEFIRISRERWRTADTATSTLRNNMRRDQLFASGGGNQWDAVDKAIRSDEGRPCLEINRIPQFIRQVSNQARANRSQIQFTPRAGGATVETASVLQGIMRGIETESDADIAYDTAVDHQLRIGLGFIRLRSKWADNTSFESVVSIDRLRNPLSVYWDPSTQDANFDDCRFMHVIGAIGKDEYTARWGTVSTYASLTEFVQRNSSAQDWMPEGKVVLAEYFYVTVEQKKLVQFSNGAVVWEDNAQDYLAAFAQDYPGIPPPGVATSRVVETRVVRWCLHNAADILEGNDDLTGGRIIPGTRIPLFPVIGDEIDLDGEIDYRGMVRDSIDPQRMYNFWASSIAETIGLAPKSPWLAEADQVAEFLDDWKEANRKTQSVLLYKAKTVDGNLVREPTRNIAEPPIQGMVTGLREADQDLKAVMGLFEASLGERGPQQSGRAITAVQQQGLVANSNFLDNLQRSKRAIGRCALDWIRAVYDTPRLLHITDPYGSKRQVLVHAGDANKPPDSMAKPPKTSDVYDLLVGEYDVTIGTGPQFPTERAEAEARLLELFKVLPGLAQIGADIVLENSDNPAAQALAKRAKLLLPPPLQDQGDPDTALARLQQENAQIKGLLEKANAAVMTMAKAIDKEEISGNTKKQVEMIRAQAQLAIAAAKLGNERDKVAFQAEYERFQQYVDHIQALVIGQADHENTLEQQAQQQAAAAEQAKAQASAQGPPGGGGS